MITGNAEDLESIQLEEQEEEEEEKKKWMK